MSTHQKVAGRTISVASFMVLVVVITLLIYGTAFATSWVNLGEIYGHQWWSPISSHMWAGYSQYGTDRYIYSSFTYSIYGDNVYAIRDAYYNLGLLPALNFDEQRAGGGFQKALSATTWYSTNAPLFMYGSFRRNDDDGNGTYEEVRIILDALSLSSTNAYYYDQEFYDINFPLYASHGEINLSGYITGLGGGGTSDWMCKFYYYSNNTFSKGC